MAGETQERGRYLREFAALAKSKATTPATPSAPEVASALPAGYPAADSSGYVDLAALMANDPDWVDRELARARAPHPPPSPSLMPVALPSLPAGHPTLDMTREAPSGRATKWILGATAAASLVVIALAIGKQTLSPWRGDPGSVGESTLRPSATVAPVEVVVATTATALRQADVVESTAAPQRINGAAVSPAPQAANAATPTGRSPVSNVGRATVALPTNAPALPKLAVAAVVPDPTHDLSPALAAQAAAPAPSTTVTVPAAPTAAAETSPAGDPLLDAIRSSIVKSDAAKPHR